MKHPKTYWNYDNCYDEAKKYLSRSGFKQGCYSAYRCAVENGWIDAYFWFSRPNNKWNYRTCMEESKKHSTRSEFATKSSGAYHVASKNKWLDEYTWLPADGRELRYKTSKWNFENCYKEALKYMTRGEFAKKNNSAYNSARKHKWIDLFTWLKDERLDIVKGKIDLVYSYEFVKENAVYVGRTLIKRHKERDKQHLFKIDSVSAFAKEHDIPVPEMKILESGLTIEEGVRQEAWWIEKYKEENWMLLNKAKAGSIGMIGKGKTKYTYEICCRLSKECLIRADFKAKYPQAYLVSFRTGWIKDFTWLKDGKQVGADKRRKYDRKTCFEEAKKYKTITEFEKGSKGACIAARAHGWMKDYTWFTLLWQEKWNKESCYNEAKKYTTLEDFSNKSASAYATACKNKWIEDYSWLQRKRVKSGYWQDYKNCYNEAKKYKTMTDFMRKSSGAYASALKKGWTKDYTWLRKKDITQLELFN